MQSPQALQTEVNRNSSTAHGGLIGVLRPEKSPRKNCILLIAAITLFKAQIKDG
jgi:hypothetical protein